LFLLPLPITKDLFLSPEREAMKKYIHFCISKKIAKFENPKNML